MSTVSQVHINFAELCQCVEISEEQLLLLITEGIVTPSTGELPEQWRFEHTCVSIVHKAARLHHDLTVEWSDIPLVLSLLDELQRLRSENDYLSQRLSRFVQDD